MTLAQKIDDILHGRVVCDDKTQAIGAAVAAELARGSADREKDKALIKQLVEALRRADHTLSAHGKAVAAELARGSADREKDKALIKQLVEALRRADHTLSAHGKIDAQTPLHTFIRAAINVFEASK